MTESGRLPGSVGWLVAPLGAAALLVWSVLVRSLPLNHDAAYFLQCGQMLLAGGMPYIDFVDFNPPLVFYLHAIPVALAGVLHTDIIVTFQTLIVIFSLGSAILLYVVLESSRALANREGRLLVTAAWIAFSLFAAASGTFGQREHLFLLAFVPWLFCREARYHVTAAAEPAATKAVPTETAIPAWIRLTMAIALGLVLPLKPQFPVFAVIAEIWMGFRMRKSFRISAMEVALPLLMFLCYGLHFFVLPSPMRQAFFGRWLPMAISHYRVYESSLARTLFLDSFPRALVVPLLAAGILVPLLFVRAADRRTRSAVHLLGILAATGLIVHIVDRKDWIYHLLPALGLSAIMVAIAALPAIRLRPIRFLPSLLLLIAGGLAWKSTLISDRIGHDIAPLVQAMRGGPPGTRRVAVISTRIYPAYPAMLYAGRLPATRYLCAFPIAMLYDEAGGTGGGAPYRSRGDRTPAETEFLAELGTDLLASAPDLVFIDTTDAEGCPDRFHVDAYLDSTGWAAQYLARYDRGEIVGDFACYRKRRSVDSSAVNSYLETCYVASGLL